MTGLRIGRRDALTALGLGALAAANGCAGGDGSAGSPTSTTALTVPPSSAPGVAPSRASLAYDPSRPYWVQGNFAPVGVEETVTELTVRGDLPRELTGLFVRNGSNAAGDTEPLHWFLGDGMIHGIRLEDGKALWYRNRWVTTPMQQAGKGLMEFGGVPGRENNQSNVAFIEHAGRLLSLGEVGWPYEISPQDLSTIGAHDFGGPLGPTVTAHPKIDPATGRMHFFGYEFLAPALTYYAAGPDGVLDVATSIEVEHATMIHDFAVTDRDVIFWIGPVMFGADEANPNPAVPFHWDPAGPSRIGVMPLDGDGADIRWVDVDPRFVFHGYNAHREGDDVVLRVHQLPQAFGPLGDLVPSTLTEWRIGTGGDGLTFAERELYDRSIDLPSHDRRYTGRASSHGWFATTTEEDSPYGFELAGITHLDLETGREDWWDPESRYRAGEGYFVPRSNDAAEGEGWVLTYIWDRETDLSVLGVFDAQNVAAGPVAEVDLGVRVPFGFHGMWVPDPA